MNEKDKPLDRVETATAAMTSEPLPQGPSESLIASTVEAMQSVSHSITKPGNLGNDPISGNHSPLADAQTSRREMMIRVARYGTLGTAASIAIVLLGSLIINQLTLTPAFGQVLENIRNASAVTYVMTQKLGAQNELKFDCAILGPKMRMESPGAQIILVDTTTRDSMLLLLPQKLAVKGKMGGDPTAKALSLREVLAEIADEHAKLVREETQSGRQIDIFDVAKLPAFLGQGAIGEDDVFRIWVDHETQLPIRVALKLKQTGPQRGSADMEMTNFDWNPSVKPADFEMVVPNGFKVKDAAELNAQNNPPPLQ